ncbi:DUF982 domain-containing protein [Mesorhizobium yinganensis]|uniref:DUF982 domain-containing protein n=1 Tax=Mesorhizobium yinganensis TaxID=3157707 RepID=UPI003CCCB97A
MAARGWWGSPVPVMLRISVAVLYVNSNLQAADILLHKWPYEGRRKATARDAVMEVWSESITGLRSPVLSRRSQRAAREAHILIE